MNCPEETLQLPSEALSSVRSYNMVYLTTLRSAQIFAPLRSTKTSDIPEPLSQICFVPHSFLTCEPAHSLR